MKCIYDTEIREDIDNSYSQASLGMKRRLSGKLSGFIITQFSEVVRFPCLIYSLMQVGQRIMGAGCFLTGLFQIT
jgi:hypothetical protein